MSRFLQQASEINEQLLSSGYRSMGVVLIDEFNIRKANRRKACATLVETHDTLYPLTPADLPVVCAFAAEISSSHSFAQGNVYMEGSARSNSTDRTCESQPLDRLPRMALVE